jgi:hypothetical protein
MSNPPANLIEFWNQTEDPEFNAAENLANPPPRAFTVMSGAELRAVRLPPKVNVLGDGVIALGQMTTIIGQGGTGKSRAAMQIAVSQVLGASFAGLATHPVPLRHLLIGTENSIHRQQGDYVRMTSKLTPGQQALVDSHVFFHVVQEIDDAFINLGHDDIRRKWLDTLELVRPDCVFIDPYGEVHIGDINRDADVRHTLRELTKVCRRHNQESAIVIIHHGRTGRQNIAQAVGFDKGNFALGSKALYSGCRCQVNIAPRDAEGGCGIVLTCGKANDFKPFAPVGLVLEEETMSYRVDADFDAESWLDNVEGKNTGQSASIMDVVRAISAGTGNYNQLCKAVCESSGCSRSTAKRRIQDAAEKNYIRRNSDGLYVVTRKAASLSKPEAQEMTGFK